MRLQTISMDRKFVQLLVAVFPLLGHTLYVGEAFLLGSVITLLMWGTVIMFQLLSAWFPEKLRPFAFFLWILALTQTFYYILGITPLWGISLYLLTPRECLEIEIQKKKRRKKRVLWRFNAVLFRQAFWTGFGFWLMMVYLGSMHELLGDRLLIWGFHHPAGSLLLLAFASFVWQNQPRRDKIEELVAEGGAS